VPTVYILPDHRLVECGANEAILHAALRDGVPFAHACGGHASCSTCRIVVMDGREACADRTAKERDIAERLGFGADFRLACQTRVTGDVTIRRLVLDQRDIDLTDIRPRFARRRAPAPVRWVLGSVVSRRSQPQPIGEERRVAVVFADIRGFTSFAAALLPYDVIHVLQRHLRGLTLAVERQEGVVTSYMGDGLMALFGAGRGERSSLRATRAALEMLAWTDDRRANLEELYGRSFDLNVGLHYGTAIVGTLWGDPPTVTAIGDTVNLASRIEQANKDHGTRFLVSAEALAELDGDVQVGRSFQCAVPGKAGEYQLTEVLGLLQ
jgi:adenylate cyclase